MEFMIEKLFAFTMVLTRTSAFFMVVPVFSWKGLPTRIKAAMTMLISIFFSMIVPFTLDSAEVSILKAVLLLCNEAIYGLGLGLITMLIFSTVQVSGRIIERQMGLAMAQILNPLTGERGQPIGMLMDMMFTLLFLSVKGHHMLLLLISRSYKNFPMGSTPTIQIWLSGITKAGSVLLMAGLRLSAPILAAFLILMVVLAILARIAPEMNILFISLPIRVGLGLLLAGIFFPLIINFISEFADWMGKLIPLHG